MKCPGCGAETTTGGCLACNAKWSQRGEVPHECPVCDGTGLVSRPPWVPGDQPTWTDGGTGPYPCRACGGMGVLWR